MPIDRPAFWPRAYPIVFASAFFASCLAQNLTANLDPANLAESFLGRPLAVNAFNSARLALGDRVFPPALLGDDGWFFYTGNRAIDEYQHSRPYSLHDLHGVRSRVESLNSVLADEGIRLMLVIVPDKSTIYPQYMPLEIQAIGRTSRLDQVVNELRAYGSTPFVDLRPHLLEASRFEQTYFLQDTHWNARGEYVGYADTMAMVARWFPQVEPHPLTDFELVNVGQRTRDLPGVMGIPQMQELTTTLTPLYPLPTHVVEIPLAKDGRLRLAQNDDQALPSAVIYYDSFFGSLVPLLEAHFRDTTSIWFGDPTQWSLQWIEQAHPDVVIVETAERRLYNDDWLPSAR